MLAHKNNRVWVYCEYVDMRKSYDGLCGLVRDSFDVLSGDLFLFVSRNRRRAKALFFDGNGLNIWMKRMERDQFANILHRKEISVTELSLFFTGSQKVVNNLNGQDYSKDFSL